MTIKRERVYVDPEFKKGLKLKAIDSGKSVLRWTHDVMVKDDPFEFVGKIRPKKVKKFEFDFP